MTKSIEERLAALESAEKDAFIASLLLARNASHLAFQQHLLRFGILEDALKRAKHPFHLLATAYKARPNRLEKVATAWNVQRNEILAEWQRFLGGQQFVLDQLETLDGCIPSIWDNEIWTARKNGQPCRS